MTTENLLPSRPSRGISLRGVEDPELRRVFEGTLRVLDELYLQIARIVNINKGELDTLASTPSIIPSGTVMLFWQAAAPTGWTQVVTQNDKALRIVSGAGGGSAGTSAFSTVFGITATNNHTLTTAEMPVHSHGVTDPTHSHTGYTDSLGAHTHSGALDSSGGLEWFGAGGSPYGSGVNTGSAGAHAHTVYTYGASTGISIQNAGSGSGHSHGIDLRVQYIDVILASKN